MTTGRIVFADTAVPSEKVEVLHISHSLDGGRILFATDHGIDYLFVQSFEDRPWLHAATNRHGIRQVTWLALLEIETS